jgi:hypothetical protein
MINKRNKTTLAIALLSILIGTSLAQPITHLKHSSAPASADPALVGGPDWNAPHAIDPALLSSALSIHVVAGDPNGTISGSIGDLARDTTGQLWVNTSGGTNWVTFVRSDGGQAQPATVIAFLGDSGINSQGVNTDNAVRWNGVVSGSSAVPYANAVLNTLYATASTEPLTMVDLGTTDLRVHNVGSPPGYGWEFSFGLALYDLLNGVGAVPTAANKPWLTVFGISGVELKQLLPGSTYGQATPAFGGLNAYNAWRVREQQILASSGRRLGAVILGSLGGNDAANSTDANAVAANMVTLAAQIRADFGNQVAIIWFKLSATSAIAFNTTVRAQQVLGCSQIPNCRLLVIDSYPQLSDNLHWGADVVWDTGLQAVEALRQMLGILPRSVTRPTLVGYGTPDYNKAAGTLAPRGYPLARHGDLELLFVGSLRLAGLATVIPTPAGWLLIGNTSNVASGETQEFALFARILQQGDLDANNGLPPPVAIATGNDENEAVRVAVRGTIGIDGAAVSYAAAFGTSDVTANGPTVVHSDDLVLTFIAGEAGGAGPTISFTASNATTGAAVLIQAPLVQNTGNFGLLGVVTGRMPLPGPIPATTITRNITSNPSGFTAAFAGN